MQEDSLYKFPIYSVVGLLEVKFDGHKAWFRFTSFEAVDNFLDNDLIFRNPYIWNEGGLGRRNNLIKQRPQLSNKDFRDDFIYHIAKTDGTEMINIGGISNFRNEDNKRTVYLSGH